MGRQAAALVLPEDLAGHTWAGLSAVALHAQLVKMRLLLDVTADAAVRSMEPAAARVGAPAAFARGLAKPAAVPMRREHAAAADQGKNAGLSVTHSQMGLGALHEAADAQTIQLQALKQMG